MHKPGGATSLPTAHLEEVAPVALHFLPLHGVGGRAADDGLHGAEAGGISTPPMLEGQAQGKLHTCTCTFKPVHTHTPCSYIHSHARGFVALNTGVQAHTHAAGCTASTQPPTSFASTLTVALLKCPHRSLRGTNSSSSSSLSILLLLLASCCSSSCCECGKGAQKRWSGKLAPAGLKRCVLVEGASSHVASVPLTKPPSQAHCAGTAATANRPPGLIWLLCPPIHSPTPLGLGQGLLFAWPHCAATAPARPHLAAPASPA